MILFLGFGIYELFSQNLALLEHAHKYTPSLNTSPPNNTAIQIEIHTQTIRLFRTVAFFLFT